MPRASISVSDKRGVVAFARGLVDLDPTDELSQRQLMAAYARAGRRGHALRQYLECRRTLLEDLGLEPSAETNRFLRVRDLMGAVELIDPSKPPSS